MNYKIRITPENQAIVKRIADENGMNPNMFEFNAFKHDYTIKNNLFVDELAGELDEELTTEQFIDLFDKKETEMDKWLRENKVKNLSHDDLTELCIWMNSDLYARIKDKFNLKSGTSLADFLFNKWNNPTEESPKVETEWQPKRGDRVLVFDNDESKAEERIFYCDLGNVEYPVQVVDKDYDVDFYENKKIRLEGYNFMKPLPIEQPKETDFKSKVIELIEKRHELLFDEYKNKAEKLDELKYILKQIKEL